VERLLREPDERDAKVDLVEREEPLDVVVAPADLEPFGVNAGRIE
jgi:hypothetical protein